MIVENALTKRAILHSDNSNCGPPHAEHPNLSNCQILFDYQERYYFRRVESGNKFDYIFAFKFYYLSLVPLLQ